MTKREWTTRPREQNVATDKRARLRVMSDFVGLYKQKEGFPITLGRSPLESPCEENKEKADIGWTKISPRRMVMRRWFLCRRRVGINEYLAVDKFGSKVK